MAQYGLMIDYEYCSGCHSCEVACKNEKELPIGKWGIKLTEVGPFKKDAEKWEWNYVPVPTSFCYVCEDRIRRRKRAFLRSPLFSKVYGVRPNRRTS